MVRDLRDIQLTADINMVLVPLSALLESEVMRLIDTHIKMGAMEMV